MALDTLEIISAQNSPTWRKQRMARLDVQIAELDAQIARDVKWLAYLQRQRAELEALDAAEAEASEGER